MTSSLLPLLLFSAFFLSFFPLHLLPLLFLTAAAAAAKSLQSCLTLCDPIDCSPPGSTVPGILQARTLEWVAISFSNAWKWKVKVKSLSRVQLLATSRTAAYQAPPSMGFSRQEYWSGLPLSSPAANMRRVQTDWLPSLTIMYLKQKSHLRNSSRWIQKSSRPLQI